MNIITYSHHFGELATPSSISKLLIERLQIIEGQEKVGRLRKSVLSELRELGWSDKMKIDSESSITITSMKSGVGLCFQTGNVSRFYADILKLQSLYLKDKASSAIYIIPTKKYAKIMGNNLVFFERLVSELELYKHIITLPIFVVGIE